MVNVCRQALQIGIEMNFPKPFFALFILILALTTVATAQLPRIPENKIYFTEEAEIYRSKLDGSGLEKLVELDPPEGFIRGLKLDAINEKMYFTFAGDIFRADFDGRNLELLATTDPGFPGELPELGLDLVGRKLYWNAVDGGELERMNLDGSNREIIPVPDMPDIIATVMHPTNRSFYFMPGLSGDPFVTKLMEFDLDTNTFSELFRVEDHFLGGGLVVDHDNEFVYLTGIQNNMPVRYYRFNFDGTGMVDLGIEVEEFTHFDRDHFRDFLYFTSEDTPLGRMRTDGSFDVVHELADNSRVSIALEVAPDLPNAMPKIYEQLESFNSEFKTEIRGESDLDELPALAVLKLMEKALEMYGEPIVYELWLGYDFNLQQIKMESDVENLGDHRELIAALMLVGYGFQDDLKALLASHGITLTKQYVAVVLPSPAENRSVDEPYSSLGDFDMDGVDNITEYNDVLDVGGDVDDFALAATDASIFSGGSGGGGSCLIEQAARGQGMEEELTAIRNFRDRYLLNNPIGSALSSVYYRLSIWTIGLD
jgi:hypothetical protein